MPRSDPPEPFRPLLRAGSARFSRDAAQRPILMFEDVYKSYRHGAPVLRGMSLTIDCGEFVFVTGPSGSGKSTLLRLCTGPMSSTTGESCFSAATSRVCETTPSRFSDEI